MMINDGNYVQQEIIIVDPDLPTFFFGQLMILTRTIAKYDNFINMPVTKHGT